MQSLLDVEELARYLKLQKQTIYNWLNQRKISGIKLGGVWRFDKKEIDNRIRTALRNHFRPEFLNRVDEVVIFNRLEQEDINKIVDIQLVRLQNRLKDKNIALEVSDTAKEFLGKSGFNPIYGARPLKRVIQKQLQDSIAMMMLKGEVKEADSVKVDASKKGEGLVFTRK